MQARVQRIASELTAAGIYNKVDTTGASIGKRYARTDEIGVPFAVTVDHKTLEDDTVTVRERDSTAQVRVPAAEVKALLLKLIEGDNAWESCVAQYPKQESAAE